jgi:magnesium transporter
MIEIYKTEDMSRELLKLDTIEKGCWINLTNPSEQELKYVEQLHIIPSFLRYPLDEEEKPRLDIEENQVLIIVDIPYVYKENNNVMFETMPLGMIITEMYFITVCLKDNMIIQYFKDKKIRDFYTFKKTRFTFQILLSIAKDFLKFLRNIERRTDDLEKTLHKSMKNKELFKVFELQKSLVFFTTSLRSNDVVMEKLLKGKYLKMYEEDQDFLEDVLIENRQAIEMAGIYSSILNGTMNAFASVISNNLNIVMKFLTSVTIVMAIPTIIYSYYGMNVKLPLEYNPFAYLYILIFSIIVSIAVIWILSKRQMF